MKRKILGYWHLWLTNHFEDVIIEQLQCLMDSGLYDECENIYVGLLGDNKSFRIANKMFEQYPKIIIPEYSMNTELYEFHTLNILKDHVHLAREEYYLFYIHGKGLSFAEGVNDAGFNGGNYWRKHMNEYIINRWKDNVAMLDFGYETCGTQLRPLREWKEHYSGNMWWSKSEYIRILKPVTALNIRNRFESEFWLCGAHPIAATISQEFVDYYSHTKAEEVTYTWTKGKEIPLIKDGIKQGRNVVHTLAWAIYSDVERAVESLYALNDKNDFEHIICDLDFPLLKGDEVPENIEDAKKSNSESLKALAERLGSKYVKMPNVGVSQNWSKISIDEKIGDGDVLLCCDPDEFVNPSCYGWVKTIGEVIRTDTQYGVVSLMMEEQFDSMTPNNSKSRTLNGIRLIDVKGSAMWAQIGISGRLINDIGGIPFPKDYPVYGHLEGAMLEYMGKLKYKWAFLPDYLVKHPDYDNSQLLRQWKDQIIHKVAQHGQMSFEHWLKMKKEGKL